MGVVYRAQDSLSGETVALKVIEPTSDAQRATYGRLFLNEVRASARLRHPDIVPVLDAGREGQCFFVVTDLVPGWRTLEHDCAPRSVLPVHEVVAIRRGLRRGVALCPRQGGDSPGHQARQRAHGSSGPCAPHGFRCRGAGGGWPCRHLALSPLQGRRCTWRRSRSATIGDAAPPTCSLWA